MATPAGTSSKTAPSPRKTTTSTAFPHQALSTLDKSFALAPPRNIPLSGAPKRPNNALEQQGAKRRAVSNSSPALTLSSSSTTQTPADHLGPYALRATTERIEVELPDYSIPLAEAAQLRAQPDTLTQAGVPGVHTQQSQPALSAKLTRLPEQEAPRGTQAPQSTLAVNVDRMRKTALVMKNGEDSYYIDPISQENPQEIRTLLIQYMHQFMPDKAVDPVQAFEFTVYQNHKQQGGHVRCPNSAAFANGWAAIVQHVRELEAHYGDSFEIAVEVR